MMAQLVTWLVCQVCGRVTPREGAVGWLDQPHKEDRNIHVVRCPEHWSEWALRQTVEGRTSRNRALMREAQALPPEPFPPYLAPMPLVERQEGKGKT